MSLIGKVFAVISLVVAVFYTGITSALVSLQENFKQKLVEAKEDFKEDKEELDSRIKGLTADKKRLEANLETVTADRDSLKAQVRNLEHDWEAATNAYIVANRLVQDQEDEIAKLNEEIRRYHQNYQAKENVNTELRRKIDELETKLADMTQQRNTLQEKLAVREKELTNVTQDLARVTERYSYANSLLVTCKERYPDVYAELIGEKTIKPPKLIRGKVTAVDHPLGLVVINAGERQGVQKGYEFIVSRGDRYIGKVKVDEVWPDDAAALYVRGEMVKDEQVEVGDDVTTKLLVQP